MFTPTSLPPQLEELRERVAGLPTSSSKMSAEERAAWVVGLQQISDAVSAASLQVLSAFDAAGDGETLHAARSTQAWLRGALGITGGDASTRVRLARRSRNELAPTIERLKDGSLRYDHVRVIDNATRDLPEEHQGEAAELLTTLACQASVQQVRQAGEHLHSVVNPDGSLAKAEQDFSRRRLHLSPLLDGMVALDGLLDAESAATLNAALTPFLVPAGSEDHRSTPQRRADGLIQLADLAMTQADLPVSGGTRPQLTLVCPSSTLTETAAGGPARLPDAPGGGAVITAVAAQRIACDPAVSPVLLNSEFVPINLGRTQRLFSPQQRKLLALRDGGCRFPGCDLPPAFTDAHHVIHWGQGGETDLANALLLCRYHHRAVHEGGWAIKCKDLLAGTNRTITFGHPAGLFVLPSFPVGLREAAIGWGRPPDTG